MEKKKVGSPNGKERRSGPDRRSSDRRDPKRESERGALTTRVGERRKQGRRPKDKKRI